MKKKLLRCIIIGLSWFEFLIGHNDAKDNSLKSQSYETHYEDEQTSYPEQIICGMYGCF